MSDDDRAPEPHPLPKTRQWVEDYRRYGSAPKPVEGEQPKLAAIPLDATGCPDLQALVERASKRRAAELGEEWIEDPLKRWRKAPHQGGYPHITPEEWVEYDRAMAEWQAVRRAKP